DRRSEPAPGQGEGPARKSRIRDRARRGPRRRPEAFRAGALTRGGVSAVSPGSADGPARRSQTEPPDIVAFCACPPDSRLLLLGAMAWSADCRVLLIVDKTK